MLGFLFGWWYTLTCFKFSKDAAQVGSRGGVTCPLKRAYTPDALSMARPRGMAQRYNPT